MSGADPRDPYAPPDEGAAAERRPAPRPDPPPGQAGSSPPGPSGLPPRSGGPVVKEGRRALAMAVAGVALLLLLPPVGGVLVLAGLILGVRAMRAAGRAGGSAPGALPAVVVGGLGTVFGLGVLAAVIYLFPEVSSFSSCRAGANTELARAACWSEFEQAYRRKLTSGP